MKAYWGVEIQPHAFFTSALDGSQWSASRPGRFIPREEPLVPSGQEARWATELVWMPTCQVCQLWKQNITTSISKITYHRCHKTNW